MAARKRQTVLRGYGRVTCDLPSADYARLKAYATRIDEGRDVAGLMSTVMMMAVRKYLDWMESDKSY